MSYSKLHSSVVNSSLWSQPDHVRILFVTLLAMADKDGCIYGSRSGLERAANISWGDDGENPWETLLNEDHESSDRMRAPENGGRRIEEIPGGFRLLNFAYYRALRSDDDRREQNRIAQARFKERRKSVSQGKPPVSSDKPASAAESHDKPPKAQAEAEAEAESPCAPASPPVPREAPESMRQNADCEYPIHRPGEDLSLSPRPDTQPEPPVEPPKGFPRTEDEVRRIAEMTPCEPADALKIWNIAMARGGRDSRGNPIQSFRHHLAAALSMGRERQARPGNGASHAATAINLEREIAALRDQLLDTPSSDEEFAKNRTTRAKIEKLKASLSKAREEMT